MLTSLENIGLRFSQALKYLKENKIIRAENAVLAGTSYKKATLTNLKNGEYLPAQEILDILENKFGISSDWIIYGSGRMIMPGIEQKAETRIIAEPPATFTSTTKTQKPDIHLKKNPTAEDIEAYVLALMALREKQMEERIVNNIVDRLTKK